MSGLWASLVLIGVALGLGGVLAGLAVLGVNVVYRHQNGPFDASEEAVEAGTGVPEVTAGARVPPQGGPAVTPGRQPQPEVTRPR